MPGEIHGETFDAITGGTSYVKFECIIRETPGGILEWKEKYPDNFQEKFPKFRIAFQKIIRIERNCKVISNKIS